MKIVMSNSIFELIKSHVCIFDKNLQNVKLPVGTNESVHGLFQLDFLSWYVDSEKIKAYGVPGFIDNYGIKDNPNRIPTEYENVYMMTEYRGENCLIDYQLVVPGKNPVKIMNWRYFKVRCGKSYEYRRRVCIYGKALKLYYMGYLPRLQSYIIKYSGECCRADLCWDFPVPIPNGIIDLDISGTNHSTTYFGEKSSPLFFRIYDKTQDLRREKNCFAWFYPERYTKECWRLEAQLSGDYSRSMAPIDWLDIMQVDKSKIEKQEQLKRSSYKTALFGVIDTVDWLTLSQQEKLDILLNGKKLLDKKIKKLKESIL